VDDNWRGDFAPIGEDVQAPGPWISDTFRTRIETAWGGVLHRLLDGHPVNAWLATPDGQFGRWVDVRTVTVPSTADLIPVGLDRLMGAKRHEQMFQDSPAWLVVHCSDDVILTTPAAETHPARSTVETFEGYPLTSVGWIPRDAWQPR
jgi:hypothetical protein